MGTLHWLHRDYKTIQKLVSLINEVLIALSYSLLGAIKLNVICR
jgi:hypothetical protein